jgi:Predicted integral membrane protein (DUF2269)
MPPAHPAALLAVHARGAAYDLVLVAHVLAGLAGLGAVAAAGLSALALRRWGPVSEPVRRYYRPGVNWAGRVLFAVPVLGLALMAMSGDDWTFADGWITAGLVLWAVAASTAELVLWPAERRLQAAVADDQEEVAGLRTQCLRVAGTASALALVLMAATVVMVAKP